MARGDDLEPIEDQASLGDLFRRLADEVRNLVRAEFALYRAEATRRALSAGWAAGFLLLAVTLAGGALTAMLVGLVLWLGQSMSFGWATLIVVGATLVVAAVLAWLGVRSISAMIDPDQGR